MGGSGTIIKPLVERLFGDTNKPSQMKHAEIRRMAAKIVRAPFADPQNFRDLQNRTGFLLGSLLLYHVVIYNLSLLWQHPCTAQITIRLPAADF